MLKTNNMDWYSIDCFICKRIIKNRSNDEFLSLCNKPYHVVHERCWKRHCVEKKITIGTLPTCCYCQDNVIGNAIDIYNSVLNFSEENLSQARQSLLVHTLNPNIDIPFIYRISSKSVEYLIYSYIATDVLVELLLNNNNIPNDYSCYFIDVCNIEKVFGRVQKNVITTWINKAIDENGAKVGDYILNRLFRGFYERRFFENKNSIKRLFNEFNFPRLAIDTLFAKIVKNATLYNWDDFSEVYESTESLNVVNCLVDNFIDEIDHEAIIIILRRRKSRKLLIDIDLFWIFFKFYFQLKENPKYMRLLISILDDTPKVHSMFRNHYSMMFEIFMPNFKVSGADNKRRKFSNGVDLDLLYSIHNEESTRIILDYLYEIENRVRNVTNVKLPDTVFGSIREWIGYYSSFSFF
jgi:hypothetical protein